jgi:hypothetical protein
MDYFRLLFAFYDTPEISRFHLSTAGGRGKGGGMKRKRDVTKPKSWAEFAPFVAPFTPYANRRLDAIIRDESREPIHRVEALLLRTSWGNHNEFACDRVTKSQEPATPETPLEKMTIKPLYQTDFAGILNLSKQTISACIQLLQEWGLVALGKNLPNPGWLWLLRDPVAVAPTAAPLPRDSPVRELLAMMRNKHFLSEWRVGNPDIAKEEDDHRAALERITALKLEAFKARKVDGPTDAASIHAMPDSGKNPSPERRGRSVHDGMDSSSTASPTSKTHNSPVSRDLASRAGGQTLNVKEEELLKRDIPSVGRSSFSPVEAPTERPTGGSPLEPSAYKEQLRAWLEKNVKIPTPLEEPELDQIAATIRTQAHFEQFQAAAQRGKNAKGWRYFVTVALDCQKHQDKYSSASVSGGDRKEDPLVKRMREDAERKKSWPTS